MKDGGLLVIREMSVPRAYLRRGSGEEQVEMKAKAIHSVARKRPVNHNISSNRALGLGVSK